MAPNPTSQIELEIKVTVTRQVTPGPFVCALHGPLLPFESGDTVCTIKQLIVTEQECRMLIQLAEAITGKVTPCNESESESSRS